MPFVTGLALAIPATLAAQATDADYARHVERLKARLPAKTFTVVIEKPFVVIGDGPPREVERRASRTVRWAVRQLEAMYFERPPRHIIDVWLFAGDRSYRRWAKALFGDEPDTPYGYYSPSDRAMVMNISTGGGTLVHEIVHPYVAANFPACPDWFNEGLGSLYEHSGVRDGKIAGLTNWRLDGLQAAIRAKALPSFEEMMGGTGRRFYRDDPGTNYAQARYLLYYLQQEGLLNRYYRSFRKNVQRDRFGIRTLREVLGTRDLSRFQDRWERYVMKLRR